MKGTISINVNGGNNVSFGTIAQGKINQLGDVSIATFADIKEQILREAVKQNESSERQRILKEKLVELEQLSQTKDAESETKADTLLGELKNGFIWLLPVLKRVVELWFPSLSI